MALPENLTSSWTQGLDLPSRLFETGSTDYELFEEDGEFVLSVEMPGFDPESISVSWDEGVLNIAAEHEDTQRGRRRTYHRRFRFPKSINDEEIAAEYNNGILEVRLPIVADATVTGTEIEVQG
ncbi:MULTISPECIES: Hsp20/alpha crystallin family protein [Halolamina]|uniref:HSP20 family protein n=1 Tax=Halolamina pelagica TaxID=699431 RepID=A0A1I5VIF7_9EURY|nr:MULTISPECIES: Hsp20/alpha crystallin family protein [Halolamina]NHX37669.1 Hsp20/alpha crystallin family protein [Halolamina sp. R1-12]SFQ06776.1 HSP20 family protein [Halolamina pelagica]